MYFVFNKNPLDSIHSKALQKHIYTNCLDGYLAIRCDYSWLFETLKPIIAQYILLQYAYTYCVISGQLPAGLLCSVSYLVPVDLVCRYLNIETVAASITIP